MPPARPAGGDTAPWTRARQVIDALRAAADPQVAATNAWFFKTGPGQYGEGDRFLGLRVPAVRVAARRARVLPLGEVERLLASQWHEVRMAGVLVLVEQFARAEGDGRRRVYDFYLGHLDRVNNWDLVDVSCPKIVGEYLVDRSRRPLDRLVRSRVLWERRVAIVSTQAFIRRGDLDDTFRLAARLLGDPEDLLHKATGWMLREAGLRDRAALQRFLARHYADVPRTMLRYAIERFPAQERRAWLVGPPRERAARGAGRRGGSPAG